MPESPTNEVPDSPDCTGERIAPLAEAIELRARLRQAFFSAKTPPGSLAGIAKQIRTLTADIERGQAEAQPIVEDQLDARRRERELRRQAAADPAPASRRSQPRRNGRGS